VQVVPLHGGTSHAPLWQYVPLLHVWPQVPQLNGSFVEFTQPPSQHWKPGIAQLTHPPAELLVEEAELVELDVVLAVLVMLEPLVAVVATLAVELPPEAPAPEAPAPPVPTNTFPPQPSATPAEPRPKRRTVFIGRAYPLPMRLTRPGPRLVRSGREPGDDELQLGAGDEGRVGRRRVFQPAERPPPWRQCP
jgi:hypothetical protein